MDLFYASTTIAVGDGEKTPFWEAPWLQGQKPRNIAPLIFKISSCKKVCVKKALHNNAWIGNIKMVQDFSMQHLLEFIDLWTKIRRYNLILDNSVEDSITWNLTVHGEYWAKSAYKAQFLGATASDLKRVIWKVWAPPKTKYFAWLVLQNRLWTADRLARRGLPNCGPCPLCKRTTETADHLLLHCRYTARIWTALKEWLGLYDLDLSPWSNLTLPQWWRQMTQEGTHRKAMASLLFLTSWEIWNERNARVFRNKHFPPTNILAKIKHEARLWSTAGAKHLCAFLPGE